MRAPLQHTILAATVVLGLLVTACSSNDGPAEPEKRVIFYSSYGYLSDGNWTIPLRAWVHEEPDAALVLLADSAKGRLMQEAGFETLDDSQEALYAERVHGFVADSESNEFIEIIFDEDPDAERFHIVDAEGRSGTDRNGLVEGTVVIAEDRAQALLAAQGSADGWLTFRAGSNDHEGSGRVRLIPPNGLSVISDIDDTIKVTDIPAGHGVVLRNTLFREFVAAPCMAEMYGAFDESTAFHYVSGGPWQLYQPLYGFLVDGPGGFPWGSFHMKNVRTNLTEPESFEDLWKLVDGGSKQATFDQKVAQIGTLFDHFPGRSFILIGDSGERDPEVFAAIRQRAGDQIAEIRIRDVIGDSRHNPGRLAGMTVLLPEPAPGQTCEELMDSAPPEFSN